MFTDCVNTEGNALNAVDFFRQSVPLFPLCLLNKLTFDLDLFLVYGS